MRRMEVSSGRVTETLCSSTTTESEQLQVERSFEIRGEEKDASLEIGSG